MSLKVAQVAIIMNGKISDCFCTAWLFFIFEIAIRTIPVVFGSANHGIRSVSETNEINTIFLAVECSLESVLHGKVRIDIILSNKHSHAILSIVYLHTFIITCCDQQTSICTEVHGVNHILLFISATNKNNDQPKTHILVEYFGRFEGSENFSCYLHEIKRMMLRLYIL